MLRSEILICVGCGASRVKSTTIELQNKNRICYDCIRTAVSRLVTKVKGSV